MWLNAALLIEVNGGGGIVGAVIGNCGDVSRVGFMWQHLRAPGRLVKQPVAVNEAARR